MDFSNILFATIASYLIGSISPGYLFGRLVKKIDIRNYGNHNTGATNTYNVVGPFFGILAGIIDAAKGGAVFLLFYKLVGGPDLALLISLFSIVGHNNPFYLGFKGGRGMSVSLGLILALTFFTRSIFAATVAAALLIRIVAIAERVKIIKPARKIYRMTGSIFPIWYWFFGQAAAFKLIIIVTVIFIVFDLLRFTAPRFNMAFFRKLSAILKPKERKFFSTTTLFLVSASAVVFYFPLPIAVISITYFLIGDTMAEIYGSVYRKYLFGRKSIEGSSIGLGFCFLAGLYLMDPLGVTLNFILKGAIFASIIEFSSQKIDDNLTIPIGTALLLKFFS